MSGGFIIVGETLQRRQRFGAVAKSWNEESEFLLARRNTCALTTLNIVNHRPVAKWTNIYVCGILSNFNENLGYPTVR